MDGYSISEAAERSGFTPSALRFYEREGLVRPARTAAGYRSYSEADVAALRFIARARSLGLGLDQVAGLVPLFRGDRCSPVQDRLRELVDGKIGETRARVTELDGFTAELQRAAGSLRAHTPDGPCDDACGCAADVEGSGEPIVCTLAETDRPVRAAEWRAALADARGREKTPGGVRLRYDRTVDAGSLAALAASENDCCRWMTFTITIRPDEVTLDVTGSAASRDAILTMFR